MNRNVTQYINYFRNFAIKHKDLRHNPLSETGNAPAGSKHFATWSADEVVRGLRSSLAWPAMLLELYEVKNEGEIVYDVRGDYQGAFTILQNARVDNLQDEIAAYELAEKIVYDVLRQTFQDHYGADANRWETPFENFHFNKIQIMPVSRLFENEFGYRVEFSFDFKQIDNINQPPQPGTFLP